MRIVVDLQGAQTESRFRGIGRYTLSVTQAMARLAAERGHELILALNGSFPDTIEPIRGAFDGLLPQHAIRVWQAPGPIHWLLPHTTWCRRAAELLREAFLASLAPDIVLVSSLFEGLGDDAATSIGGLPGGDVPTAAILYDLIPMIYRDIYLNSPIASGWFDAKVNHLRRADLVLAISDSSRREPIRHLGIPEEIAVNIAGAADERFRPVAIAPERERELRRRHGLQRPFVMYTGGFDPRKSVDALVRAFAALPRALRADHQLAIVGRITELQRTNLTDAIRRSGLSPGDVAITDFVSDEELVEFYSLCHVFVFPSWHEGFGLPALEAMSCGAPVIAADSSSLPEVMGRADAMFAPKDEGAITAKLQQVLTDDGFRAELQRHGLEQAKHFSWAACAGKALDALEMTVERASARSAVSALPPIVQRPRLAYVTPPPAAGLTGAPVDALRQTLSELERHYAVELVLTAPLEGTFDIAWRVCDAASFRRRAASYDRVLYALDDTAAHGPVLALAREIPGVVLLGDVSLAEAVRVADADDGRAALAAALYRAHGYAAIKALADAAGDRAAEDAVIARFPPTRDVLGRAAGVIVASDRARAQAAAWWGDQAVADWAVVPATVARPGRTDRQSARQALGLTDSDFVVCGFGGTGAPGDQHDLIEAWLASPLAAEGQCLLVLIGADVTSERGAALFERARAQGPVRMPRLVQPPADGARAEMQQRYLDAADVAVCWPASGKQAAADRQALRCLAHGLAVVAANDPSADPDAGPDADPAEPALLVSNPEPAALAEALATLWRDSALRQALTERARQHLANRHAPRLVADRTAEAIEHAYRRAATGVPGLTRALAAIEPAPSDPPPSPAAWQDLAVAVARALPDRTTQRQLLVDISELVRLDSGTGIQRVVRNILRELLARPPAGYRVEPVYATLDTGYRYAHAFTFKWLGCTDPAPEDAHIEFQAGDLFFALDLQHYMVLAHQTFFKTLQNAGVEVCFVVYDLLPVRFPHYFRAGDPQMHEDWLTVVTQTDGAICISKAVADELAEWLATKGPKRHRALQIDWFHLGADIDHPGGPAEIAAEDEAVLREVAARPSFLSVATVEPRKGHGQMLGAIEQLWADGQDVALVLVGRPGWMVESLEQRIRKHREFGRRLWWLAGISDAYLDRLYAAASCLIAASEGEGFGLPLIEAAQHGLPILARDIPVFREVAGTHAAYFAGDAPEALATALRDWLTAHAAGSHPRPDAMPWLTWAQSADRIVEILTAP